MLRANPAPPPIARLLQSSRPLAVFRGVGTIIVHTLQGVSLGARSHVFQKCRGTLHPFLAHKNSSSPISRPVWRLSTGAPPFGRVVGGKLRRRSSSYRRTVLQIHLAGKLSQNAPATCRVPGSQVCDSGSGRRTAITSAIPVPPVARATSKTNSGKLSELLPRKIKCFHGGTLLFHVPKSKAFDAIAKP